MHKKYSKELDVPLIINIMILFSYITNILMQVYRKIQKAQNRHAYKVSL